MALKRVGMQRRDFLKVAGLVAAGGAIAACSSDGSPANAGAASASPVAGSTITIYTAANVDVMKLLTDQFTKDTGVKATVYRDSSGLVAQRFLKEQQANQ